MDIFTVLPQGSLRSPTVCYGLAADDVAAWTVPSSVKLYHYTDDIMLNCDSLTELEYAAPQLLAYLQG